MNAWSNFNGGDWETGINVRDFIQKNYTPYDGDESFLAGPTEATDKLWGALQKLQERMNTETGTEGNNEGLEDFDSRVKEFHSRFSFINESCRPSVHT